MLTMMTSNCHPRLEYTLSTDRKITGVTVYTDGNSCTVPIPVTFPGAATVTGGGATVDQVGSEPPIQWVTLSGSPKTFTLTTPIPF
jgi:hypothetical protein